jgi:hypothetical protein
MTQSAETIPTAPATVIAEITDYPSLVAALRLAREKRNISFATIDEIVTAPDAYFSKTLAPNGSRRLTMLSLGWALGALGVKCLLVDDPAALARVESRMKPRNTTVVRNASYTVISAALTSKLLARIGRKGGKNRWLGVPPAERRRIAQRAIRARWSPP